jgi:hypothetical protein
VGPCSPSVRLFFPQVTRRGFSHRSDSSFSSTPQKFEPNARSPSALHPSHKTRVSPVEGMSQSVSRRRAHPRSFHHQLPPPFSELQVDSPNPDHLLVTASFGRILTTTQLGAFLPTRRLNVHPSLLPAYRGPAPIQHTLLNGEQETGVCIINMLKKKEGIDAGGIWGCTRVVCVPWGLGSLKILTLLLLCSLCQRKQRLRPWERLWRVRAESC